MATQLEFEKPIYELKTKIESFISFGKENNVDVSSEISLMEKKLITLKKKIASELSALQKVQLARHPDRPYTRDYINFIFKDFLELHGDRRYADDGAIIGGFATIAKQKVMLIGTQKGRNLKDNKQCNFGSPYPEGYRKALRLMKIAERADLPIVSLIDTPGAYPGIESEERHIAEAIAVNIREMFLIKVPIIVTVIGEGGSGGALGIGIGNIVAILENAYYSVITPEGCAAILWKDPSRVGDAAKALKLTSAELIKMELVDEIIKEPLGGAHYNPEQAASFLEKSILKNINLLSKKSTDTLKKERYDRFRAFGVFEEKVKNTA